eukprot:Skav217829  [mRNA]  locus=scaffold889:457882:465073:+ [translate_table: standard]
MQDLEAIVRSLMEDQGKLAVTCIDSQRDPRPAPGAPYDAPAPPPPPAGAPLTQPIPVVLNLLKLGREKHDSKEVCERALGLMASRRMQRSLDALVASNPLHRDAVWHNGGIPLVVTMLKDGPAEQVQRACTLLRTLACQREAQMAVAWAGAIPILVEHLNHDTARVRIEAARALFGAGTRQDNITRAGAIPPLISLLDHTAFRELAAAVLAKLAHEHEDNQIKLLSDESTSIRETSAGLLHALVAGSDGKAKMGAIPLLIDVVNDTESAAPAASPLGKRKRARSDGKHAATALGNLAVMNSSGSTAADLKILKPWGTKARDTTESLVLPLTMQLKLQFLHCGPWAAERRAVFSDRWIWVATVATGNKEAIGQLGGVDALARLLADGPWEEVVSHLLRRLADCFG